jgi:hypothetical protein
MKKLISEMGYRKKDFYKMLDLVEKYDKNIERVCAKLSRN